MIKVLHLLPGLGGGIGSMIMTYYEKIDKNKFTFDFAVFNGQSGLERKAYIEQNGGKVFVLPRKSSGVRAYVEALKKIMREGNYDIVHSHENNYAFISLCIAKSCGIKGRIMHSHLTAFESGCNIKNKVAKIINRALMYNVANVRIACGEKSGIFLYGKKAIKKGRIIILPNAVQTDRFLFDMNARNETRRQLNLDDDTLTLLFVGRLAKIKNIDFILQLLTSMSGKVEALICGSGPEKEFLEDVAKKKNVSEKTIFLGNRNDLQNIYSAGDVFILPSFAEGFPVSVVEALTNGLPCLLSDTITTEFSKYTCVKYLSLEKPWEWIEKIERMSVGQREDNVEKIKNDCLDINYSVGKLASLYEKAICGEQIRVD